VAETARQAEICTSLLYRWRRTMVMEPSAGAGFVPVVVKGSAPPSGDPVVIVEFAAGARVSVGAGAPAGLVAAVLQALR
jgi:transposase